MYKRIKYLIWIRLKISLCRICMHLDTAIQEHHHFKMFCYIIFCLLVIRHSNNPFKVSSTVQNRWSIKLWLYCNNVNCLYLESMCIFQKMAAILNFGGHFWSYIHYYKYETLLMPNKTFVDISLVYCKKLFYVDD